MLFKWLFKSKAEKQYARGLSLAQQGRWPKALTAFQHAIALQTESPTSWRLALDEAEGINQGLRQEAAGQTEAARLSYAKVLNCGNGFWSYDRPRKKAASSSRFKAALEFQGADGHVRCEEVLLKEERVAIESPIERIRTLNQAGRIVEALDVLRAARSGTKSLWQECALDQLEAALWANKEWLCKHYPDFEPVSVPDIPVIGTSRLIIKYSKTKRRVDISLKANARSADVKTLFLFVNDRIIKSINLKNVEDRDAESEAYFRFLIRPSLVNALPEQSRLALGSAQGILLSRSGAREFWLRTEGGQGNVFELLSNDGYVIDKKGELHEPFTQRQEWQRGVLNAYTELRAYFKERFGKDLFIVFGALLGIVRENNFIASDDDLDVAFFSSRTSVEEVKEEVIGICRQLAKDGWEVLGGSAHKRRMCHVLVNGFDLDFFAAWEEDGKIWLQNVSCHQGGKEIFFPLQTRIFNGVEILIPHQYERMLEEEYGPDWRIPDPGYQTPKRTEIREHLRKALLTPDEYTQLVAEGVLRP